MCYDIDKGQLQRLLTVLLALSLSEPTGNREAMQEPQTEGAQGPRTAGMPLTSLSWEGGGREQGWSFQLSERMLGFWVNLSVLILNPLQLQQTQPASHTSHPQEEAAKQGFSLSTPGILIWIVLCRGAVLWLAGYLAASLASTHQVP